MIENKFIKIIINMNLVYKFQSQSSTIKNLALGVPTTLLAAGGAYFYKKRSDYLADPVL